MRELSLGRCEPYELWCSKLAQLGTASVPVEAAESGNRRHRRIRVAKPRSCADRCPAALSGNIDTSLLGVSYFDVLEKLGIGKREESLYRFLRRLRGGNTVAIETYAHAVSQLGQSPCSLNPIAFFDCVCDNNVSPV